MNSEVNNRRLYTLIVFGCFFLFFLLFFSQYIIQHSFPGISDNIIHLSIFKSYKIHLLALFRGEEVGNALYPTKGPQVYLEPYFGEALLYNIVSIPFSSDSFSYYIFISLIYALNALGLYRLCLQLTGNKLASIFGGLVFAASAYALSNYELLNGLVFFPSFFALSYFERYVKDSNGKFLFLAAVWAGVQAYFSLYFFMFLFFVLVILSICRVFTNQWNLHKTTLKQLGVSILIVLTIIAPVMWWLFCYAEMKGAYNPLAENPSLAQNFSINFMDLLRGLPGNVLYGHPFGLEKSGLLKNDYYCNVGLLVIVLFVASFFVPGKKILFPYYLLFAFGLLIALGPEIRIGNISFGSPLKFLYQNEGISSFFRIPGRAYNLSVLGLAVSAAWAFSFLMDKIKRKSLKIVTLSLALIIVCVENLPAKLYTPDTRFVFSPNKEYINYLKEAKGAIVLELPSSLFTNSVSDSLAISEFGREYVYTYWQGLHGKNIINGSSAFFPQSRISNNVLILNAKTSEDIKTIMEKNNVSVVVFHKKFIMNENENSLLTLVNSVDFLTKELENNEVIIYKTK